MCIDSVKFSTDIPQSDASIFEENDVQRDSNNWGSEDKNNTLMKSDSDINYEISL